VGICNGGLAVLSDLSGSVGSLTAFTKLANGSGTTAFAAAQTALVTENTTSGLAKADATNTSVTTTVTNDTLNMTKTWSVTGAATVAEVAAFNTDGTPVMLCRSVLGTARTLANGDSYTLTIKIQYS